MGRDHAIVNQMKRAAVSIAANIAEGYERGTRRQHIELCYYAKGSAGELRSHVRIARDAELIDEATFAWFMETCERCSKQWPRTSGISNDRAGRSLE